MTLSRGRRGEGAEGEEETERVRYKMGGEIREMKDIKFCNIKFCNTRTRTQNVISCINPL